MRSRFVGHEGSVRGCQVSGPARLLVAEHSVSVCPARGILLNRSPVQNNILWAPEMGWPAQACKRVARGALEKPPSVAGALRAWLAAAVGGARSALNLPGQGRLIAQ